MTKSKVLIWRSGNDKPDTSPMVVSHVEDEPPKFIQLASFESSNILHFKLLDITINNLLVYRETHYFM